MLEMAAPGSYAADVEASARERRLRPWLWCAGALLLLAQLGALVAARLGPERYFAWAPYDELSRYEIEVVRAGETLSARAVGQRYRCWGQEHRSIAHVQDIIEQYEQTYGRDESVRVVLRYRTNGGPERRWHWPSGQTR